VAADVERGQAGTGSEVEGTEVVERRAGRHGGDDDVVVAQPEDRRGTRPGAVQQVEVGAAGGDEQLALDAASVQLHRPERLEDGVALPARPVPPDPPGDAADHPVTRGRP
jgi:hypothetical protein